VRRQRFCPDVLDLDFNLVVGLAFRVFDFDLDFDLDLDLDLDFDFDLEADRDLGCVGTEVDRLV
jgi:hypothetical protein